MDQISPERRSWNMSRIRSKNTTPELKVRSMLHRMGYRFRLHRKDLPGKPDIVLSRYKKIIFVHGCFWHSHSCKKGQHLPGTRIDYWKSKLAKNKERDNAAIIKLHNMGWKVLVVWECETKDEAVLKNLLYQYICK